MSFVNGALDSSPVQLPKINPLKRAKPSLDDVASRVASVSVKKRKADSDHASLHETNGVKRGEKRLKTVKRGGRENGGDDHPTQRLPTIPEKKKKESKVKAQEQAHDEATIERFLRIKKHNVAESSRQKDVLRAPLTPPASYRTIQPRGPSETRAVSEPASPSTGFDSPSSMSSCSTVTDAVANVDLDNPFLATPAGMTRSSLLLSRRAPETPDDLPAQGGFLDTDIAPLAGADEDSEKKLAPPVYLDSSGERNYLTYVL